jgi:hypothetical protein
VNSCVNSPEDGPVAPKHVEIRRYMNKIGIVTSVGFSFHRILDVDQKNGGEKFEISYHGNEQI